MTSASISKDIDVTEISVDVNSHVRSSHRALERSELCMQDEGRGDVASVTPFKSPMTRLAFLPPLPLSFRHCHPQVRRCAVKTNSPPRRPASASLTQDAAITSAVTVAASAALYGLQRATASGLLTTKLNRKLIHIATGPALLSLWPFYSDHPASRLIAAVVPAFFIARLLYSASRDTPLALSVSRDNKATEAAKGPVIYVTVILVATLAAFQTSISAIAVSQLAFGDGFADIFGRAFGAGTEWRRGAGGKTAVGSAAFAGAAFAGTVAMLKWYEAAGLLGGRVDGGVVAAVGLVSVACAAAEVLLQDVLDDNVAVPVVAAALAVVLLPGLR